MEPLVSILIPAYNAERWIRETIESALNQTWPRKEIIVIDDGSSDDTFGIASRYESKSVKVIRQQNSGGPAARNRALSYAQGDFIQWLDHDDLLAPDKIFSQLKSGEFDGNTRILLSGSFGTFFFRKEKAKFQPTSLWKHLKPIDYFLIKFAENTFLHSTAWLVSRRLTEMAGPWGELRSPDDDGEYFSGIIVASEEIRFIGEAKSYWRVGNYGSMSQNRSNEAVEALFVSICKGFDHLRSLEDSQRTKKACLDYLQCRFRNFYPEKKDLVGKAYDLAEELGGSLSPPKLKWKYIPIRILFGWETAIRTTFILPQVKALAYRNWDRLNYKIFGP